MTDLPALRQTILAGGLEAPRALAQLEAAIREECARCVEQDPSRANKWELAHRIRALAPTGDRAEPATDAITLDEDDHGNDDLNLPHTY